MRDLEAQLRAYGLVLDGTDAGALTDVDRSAARAARRSLLVVIAAVVVIAIAVATFAVSAHRSGNAHRPNIVTPGSSQPTTPASTSATPGAGGVLAIGDSVMLGAKVALEQAIPGIAVDAVVSRQFAQAADVLTEYAQSGALPPTIVVALGTNALPTDSEIDAFMRAAGASKVYLVTVRVPRAWETATNVVLRAASDRWPNAHVHRLEHLFGGPRRLVPQRRIPPHERGQQAYSTLISAAIGQLTQRTPSGLDVAAVIPETMLPPQPLAVAGGDVWIANESAAAYAAGPSRGTRPRRLQRWSARSTCRNRPSSRSRATATRCGSRVAATVGCRRRRCRRST